MRPAHAHVRARAGQVRNSLPNLLTSSKYNAWAACRANASVPMEVEIILVHPVMRVHVVACRHSFRRAGLLASSVDLRCR